MKTRFPFIRIKADAIETVGHYWSDRDQLVSAIENRIGVRARISELVYEADPSPTLSRIKAVTPGSRTYCITNPSGSLLAELAQAEESATTRPEIIELTVRTDVHLRHRETGNGSFSRTLIGAHDLFVNQLDPWGGPCIGPRAVARYDASGLPLRGDTASEPGIRTVFGNNLAQAHIELILRPLAATATDEQSLRITLVLGKLACAANGINDARSLLRLNGRQVFGRYIHLASGGKYTGVGDLNARVKRELGRMITRAAGTAT